MESIQSDLLNQDAENSLQDNQVSEVALKCTNAGKSNVNKKNRKHKTVACNNIIEAQITRRAGKTIVAMLMH